MAGEFDAIDKPQQSVDLGGRTFVVRPFTVGQIPAITRALAPVIPRIAPLMAAGGLAPDGSEAAAVLDASLLPELLSLIGEHGDTLIEAVALAVRSPRTAIEELDPLEFVALILPIIRVNADFFARRLQPMLLQAMASQARNGGGQTPSRA